MGHIKLSSQNQALSYFGDSMSKQTDGSLIFLSAMLISPAIDVKMKIIIAELIIGRSMVRLLIGTLGFFSEYAYVNH